MSRGQVSNQNKIVIYFLRLIAKRKLLSAQHTVPNRTRYSGSHMTTALTDDQSHDSSNTIKNATIMLTDVQATHHACMPRIKLQSTIKPIACTIINTTATEHLRWTN